MKVILRLWALGMTLAGLIFLNLFAYRSDDLDVVSYTYHSDQVPTAFDGFKIVQISDLHNHPMQYANRNLLTEIQAASPDVIFITGDMVDSMTKDMGVLTDLFEGIAGIPTYYVNGNHEMTSAKLADYQALCQNYGIINLNSMRADIVRGDESIHLFGVDDGLLQPYLIFAYKDTGAISETIRTESADLTPEDLTIVLAHRPSLYQDYIDTGMDLVFGGHYHGSQVKIGGFGIAQVWHRWYEGGMTDLGGTTMVVSAGLGTEIIPIRYGANAQLVITTLATL